MLRKGPQRMGDKESLEINAAGENYRVNTAKVIGGGARVGSSFVVMADYWCPICVLIFRVRVKRTPEHKAVTWGTEERSVRTYQSRGAAAVAVDGKCVDTTGCFTVSVPDAQYHETPCRRNRILMLVQFFNFYQDFKQCLPSLIILIVGLTLMVLVIPYAFASVIKQLQEEEALRNMRNNDTMLDLKETQTNVAL